MRRQQAGNVVHTNTPKSSRATAAASAPSRPKPLDADTLKKVAGGTSGYVAPHKGW
jgi:hypothetical protein